MTFEATYTQGGASRSSRNRVAIIIGAGPAGLTAAYELLQCTDIKPIVIEASDTVGGLSRTVEYKGNRIDIGGHRFFSKSSQVVDWWLSMLPPEATAGSSTIRYQGRSTQLAACVPAGTSDPDQVMLLRERKSHIYCFRQFFDYPLSLSFRTMSSLGPKRLIGSAASYLRSTLFPIADERSLEDFLVNRFGRYLYNLFFRSYTEKVWGVPCNAISAEWGAQRIKGLSISRAVAHAIVKPFRKADATQQSTETSLIERFMYPKYGPGQLWEVCAERVRRAGGEIHFNQKVAGIEWDGSNITCVHAEAPSGSTFEHKGDYFISTMPVQDLVGSMGCDVPEHVQEVAKGLVYRDFITVGLLVRRLAEYRGHTSPAERDTWIYIQDPSVRIGRLQIFNNWSPSMVSSSDTVWLGLEYFCSKGDDLWALSDEELSNLGASELDQIGLVSKNDVLDSTVLRVEKTYPAYFGSHDRFSEIRTFLDGIGNLFLIGRNGMHRYNNQDHSMLTAMEAVKCIRLGETDKSCVWDVNTEKEYHEEVKSRHRS